MDLYLERGVASGVCRRCKTSSLYTKSTCDHCGDRLPWADGIADQMEENCPRCQTFNTYIRAVCFGCDEQLPWHDGAAALYHAHHDSEKEQKSLAWTLVIAIVGVVWILAYVFGMLQMSR